MPDSELFVPQSGAQRRLVYRASRRSMAEMERVFHRFLLQELATLDEGQCRRLESLLDCSDADLLDWMAGIKPVPAEVDGEMLARLSRHSREAETGKPV
ncbi:MAG: succinate dehydrogenase assembly factor 2 [Magnetococcales bacterium]|nr:succinate dehydrogenase assembly factor 2 [Magnetococcales bacterium]